MILDDLKSTPFRRGDLQKRDAIGRNHEILVDGDWLITFWCDHGVREIRIVRLELVED